MTRDRHYPDSTVGGFPTPPAEVVDDADRRISIVELSDEDADAVDRLVEMYVTFDPAHRAQGIPPVTRPAIREWLEVVLADGPDVIAIHAGDVVGHATLVPERDDEFELAIFVHQAYQRHGIGSQLLRMLLGVAESRGIAHVWLTVERWNAVAISLYESVGFRTCGSGSFELEMSLRLG